MMLSPQTSRRLLKDAAACPLPRTRLMRPRVAENAQRLQRLRAEIQRAPTAADAQCAPIWQDVRCRRDVARYAQTATIVSTRASR